MDSATAIDDEMETEELDDETLAEIERLAAQATTVDEELDESDEILVGEIDDEEDDINHIETVSPEPTETKTKKVFPPSTAKDLSEIFGEDTDDINMRIGAIGAVKTVDKANNLMDFVRGKRKAMSNYTRIVLSKLEELAEDRKGMKPNEYVSLFEENGYKTGTARSQGQQIATLLVALGMVSVNKDGTQKLLKSSKVYEAVVSRYKELEATEEESTDAA